MKRSFREPGKSSFRRKNAKQQVEEIENLRLIKYLANKAIRNLN